LFKIAHQEIFLWNNDVTSFNFCASATASNALINW